MMDQELELNSRLLSKISNEQRFLEKKLKFIFESQTEN